MSFRVEKSFRLFFTVNNIFDRDPPLAPNGVLSTFTPTNPALYDVVGRQFTAGVDVSF